MKVLIAGDWTENYLTLGGKVYHVGAEDLAAAKREAEAIVRERIEAEFAKIADAPTPAPSPAPPVPAGGDLAAATPTPPE